MPRLKADRFSVDIKSNGTTDLKFRGEGNREFEISVASITLMGIAKAIHLATKQAPVPVLPATKAAFRKLEPPVGLPVLPPQPNPAEALRIEVGVTADLEMAVASLTSPDTGRIELLLPLADVEVLLEGLQKAAAAIKHKPRATKH